MKITATLFTIILTTVFYTSSFAQYEPIEYAIRLTATVNENPPSITLNWDTIGKAEHYVIYKKTKTASTWQDLKVLNGIDSSYTDNAVIADSAYEYRVSTSEITPEADGYIYAGIKLHATDYRGKMLLVIDSTFIDSLSTEITQLMEDISADGWAVTSHYVSRNASPPHVKAYIKSQYLADSQNVKGLLLLGHVPVPYSGDLNPDGHPQHLGAWPADAYYGDIHGKYTDSTVTDTASDQSYTSSRNIPGDGKFDQSVIPGHVVLEMGRIDLDSLPSFPKTEKQLLQQYLNRDHDYRFKNFTTIQRGLINDNFGTYGEGFASCAWRNFPPMFSDTGTHTGGYFSTLNTQNYLWSYGCGGGDNFSAGGVGSTTDFANDTPKSVFTMLFGSYFGDWNHPDNFLRAPLASPGLILTCAWGGRPMWFFHHMAMGETIGFGTMITQNNGYYFPYYPSYGQQFINIALMGDPSLRQHVIAPPQNVTYTIPASGWGTAISWYKSPDDSVAGYYIYRSTSKYGKYSRLTPSILTAPPYVDNPPASGLYYYYVKAVKCEHTPSGSYLNTSEGIGDSVTEIISGIADRNPGNENFMLYPNPASESTLLLWRNVPAGQYSIVVKDELGRTIYNTNTTISSSYYSMPLSVKEYSAGCYYVEAINETNQFVQKLIVGK